MNTKTFHKVETNEVDDVPQHTLADVTPKLEKIWFKYPWLFQLNISHLLGGILAQVTSGYDGSMMNNLQTLPSCREYFENPAGSRLGTMTNVLSIGTLISISFT